MRVEKTDEYRDWIDNLKDVSGRAGPGYRVYYMQRADRLLLLLIVGDKATQTKDIARAIRLARTYGE
jgi:putative component of toxin-antitoxin plasmid stabilization module